MCCTLSGRPEEKGVAVEDESMNGECSLPRPRLLALLDHYLSFHPVRFRLRKRISIYIIHWKRSLSVPVC